MELPALFQLYLLPVFTGLSCVSYGQQAPPKTIHVFVALCDNKYQGIVPVPAAIGNGQNENTNLYWGCEFGLRTYFKKSPDWVLIESRKSKGDVLERLIFKNKEKNFFLVADAYDGSRIKKCVTDFLSSSCGRMKDSLTIAQAKIGIYGNASLVAYVGHDGLMDFDLNDVFNKTDGRTRDCIILACFSKNYFSLYTEEASANMLLWTTGLMCPEAYTLHDALVGYVNNESKDQIRARAVQAYSVHQKCSEKAAKQLLVYTSY